MTRGGESVERLRHRKAGIKNQLDLDIEALLRRHDHYRAEFHHHSGGDGMDCDCVELADKFARGEIE